MNLILNAREAMLPHGGKLTISAQADNDCFRIKISDTGCGIEQSELSRVFDTFFTTKHKKIPEQSACGEQSRTGTGLGLSLCKKVIDAHAGTITVESQPGKGTTFTITLPKK